MSSVLFIDHYINNAEQMRESVSEPSPNTKIYFAYGRVQPWANDSAPPIAQSTIGSLYDIWNNMIGGKRLVTSDFSHAVRRINWTANTEYQFYDHDNPNLYDANTNFYVVNSSFSVFKCIANNNGALSTVEPQSFNSEQSITTADGYVWKYMYTISDSDQLRFLTSDYIPVKTLRENDSSLQWLVQSNATKGSVEHIQVISGGSGYSNTSNLSIVITGDGTGLTAVGQINVTAQKIESILITDPGQNYSYANVSVVGGGGSGAVVRAIISPPGGHGSDPVRELGGRNLVVNPRLRYSENGVIPSTNDYRQIILLKDPDLNGTSNVASVDVFNQCMVITTSGSGEFAQDEYVYQGNGLLESSFQGQVVSYDPNTNKVFLINTKGTPVASRLLIGSTSLVSRVVASVTEPTLEVYSGKIIYLNNIRPVTRSSDQIEDYKIVIKF